MSDIPRAKEIIDELFDGRLSYIVRRKLRQARRLMDREKPEFKVDRDVPRFTRKKALLARRLRKQHWGLNRIARYLDTQIGRVSEAVNGKRKYK